LLAFAQGDGMVDAVQWSWKKADSASRSEVRACSVYEIDGRLLVRTVDQSDHLGLERAETIALDGFPEVPATAVGAAVVEALDRTREIPRPTSWRRLSGHAQPLLAASPSLYRSYRTWQRTARHVSVLAKPDKISVTRWHPDLSRGSWVPAADVGRPVGDWPQEIELPAAASLQEIGTAVLDGLSQPSLRDAY
jgi:hypothetical protein